MEEQIYEYLNKNCVGYDNRVKGNQIMKLFGIHGHKTFRSYIQAIREKDFYKKLVGSEAGKQGGYWIVNSVAEYNTTTQHLYARSSEMRKMCEIMKKKWGKLNGK